MYKLDELGRYEELLEIYNNENIIGNLKLKDYELDIKKAEIYKKLGNYQQTIDLLKKNVDKSSIKLNELNNFYEEIIQNKKYIELGLNIFDLYKELVFLHKREGNIIECKKYLNEALKIKSNDDELISIEYFLSKKNY